MRNLPLAAVLLAACSHAEPPAKYVPPERPDDSCNSAPYREYVGQPVSVLDDLVIPDPKRIIPMGAPATMDYNPVRVNFDLDAASNITRIWCG